MTTAGKLWPNSPEILVEIGSDELFASPGLENFDQLRWKSQSEREGRITKGRSAWPHPV